jgi:hypothetical protein
MTPVPQPDLPARVRRILRHAVRGTRGGEVDHVWSLFRDGLQDLADELRACFGDCVTLNGVFCHGRPIVDFDMPNAPPGTKGCELGDLLIAVNQVLPAGEHDSRALLMQCKMADGPRITPRQKYLYAHWPPFQYSQFPDTRHLRPPADFLGAQFAFIDRAGDVLLNPAPGLPSGGSPWEHSLALAIVAMTAHPIGGGQPYLPHHDRGSDATDWSRIVWDLLQTMFSASTYANRGDRVLDTNAVRLFLDVQRGVPESLARTDFAAEVEELWRAAANGEVPGLDYDGPAEEQDARPVSDDRPPPGDLPPSDDEEPPDEGRGLSVMLFEVDWQRRGMPFG